jgi:hypothetical protein
MTLHSFPKALETAAPSDRGVESPQGIPVASIIVRYSVASDSSRVGNDGWARVRYTSCGPSPLFRQGRAGFLNWFGHLARGLLRSPHQACKQAARVFTVSLRPGPSCVVAHEQQRSERSLSWVTRNMLRVTKCL